MIFVTVGAQMPFDRLIEWMDEWAAAHGRGDVLAQIGPSTLEPRAIEVAPFMDPPRFRETLASADCIVAHAGMGTILTALELGKPILVVPRLGALMETRNDHQVATAERFARDGLVRMATTPEELDEGIAALEASPASRDRISAQASDELLARLRLFLTGDAWPPEPRGGRP